MCTYQVKNERIDPMPHNDHVWNQDGPTNLILENQQNFNYNRQMNQLRR